MPVKNDLNSGVSRVATIRMLAPVAMLAANFLPTSAQAQLLCLPQVGIDILCATNPPPADPGTPAPAAPVPVVGPAVFTLLAGVDSTTGIALQTLGVNADLTLTPVATAVVNAIGSPALTLNSGGGIDARITRLTASGNGGSGAVLRAVDGVLFRVDDLVSTIGDAASGIDIEGGSITVNAGDILTTGDSANGVDLLAINGPAILTADLIDTSGNLSTAALLRAAGRIDLNVGVLRTAGGQALGIDIATDPAACVLLGNGGCGVTAAADQITTGGFGGIGALISAAAPVSLNIGVLQTGGDQAAGINLIADPTLCAALGTGACDTNFTVGNLLTGGADSLAALIRAAGNVTGAISVLKTNGANAIGLDFASDPDACVLLGRGGCGNAFTIGQLTTSGAGATGVLARVVGPTTARIGLLGTSGDDATGSDLAADPTACALIGSGACDIDLAVDRVTTTGNGALGVLIDAPANILATIGALSTAGDNATALQIITSPTVCLVLGPGACSVDVATGPIDTGGDNAAGVDIDGGSDPITVDTGDVSTGGDGSDGVTVTGDGPITVTTGDVTTGGDGSAGVVVDGGTGPITVTTGDITTGGDDSPGVDVDGEGLITVTTQDVTTAGDGSGGILVDGGDGPVVIDFDDIATTGDASPGVDVAANGPITITGNSVMTSGTDSDGIVVAGGAGLVAVTVGSVGTAGGGADGVDVTTTTGNQTLVAGPVTVTGAGANGIVGQASGCAAVAITAVGPVTATQGTGILASSACGVSVTTQPGATVSGQAAGIDVTSGTGSTITLGAAVSATAGPAIDADGAGTAITIATTGQVSGYVDLTDANDTITNNGVFAASGTSAFGGGTDAFANTGRLTVGAGGTAAAAVTFTGLESLTNSGTIDLRNGHAGDTLTLPGSYAGTGGAVLGLDVSVGANGTVGDRLVIGGAATGSTAIALQPLQANPGILVQNLVLVDAGAGSSAGAFTLAGGPFTSGLVGYSLVYDPAAATYGLYGTPTTQAYEFVKLGGGARELAYRAGDAVASHWQAGRDADTPDRGSAVWTQMYGSVNRDRSDQSFTAFGQTLAADLAHKQDYYGAQFGIDLGGLGRDGITVGLTGGYASSTLGFSGNADRFGYQSVNGGAYMTAKAGAIFLSALAKYDRDR